MYLFRQHSDVITCESFFIPFRNIKRTTFTFKAERNKMSSVNSNSEVYHDSYGYYISSPPLPPVPPFPCTTNVHCTADNRICQQHKYVLFVKTLYGQTFEIPYGNWENWLWYKERIHDRTGIPVDKMRLIFAETDREDLKRHSGLQYQSTIHLVERKTS